MNSKKPKGTVDLDALSEHLRWPVDGYPSGLAIVPRADMLAALAELRASREVIEDLRLQVEALSYADE